jgi:uncharacterized protein YdaU (DUF1376 family)
MASFPALPLWTDAYLADTNHLTDAEHGLYLRLLMVMWRSPRCRVPNDDAWLARRLNHSETHIANALRPLIKEFFSSTGNWLYQKRLLKEWKWCTAKSKKNSDAANVRWDNEKHISERNAPTPTPTPIGIERKKEATNGRGRGKPRHRQTSKDGRVWLDVGTEDFSHYAADYLDRHHAPIVLCWGNSGAWFNLLGENTDADTRSKTAPASG